MSNRVVELDEEDLRLKLAEACTTAGGQAKWAEATGLSRTYVNDVLNSKRAPGHAIARALGYRKKTIWVPDAWDEPTPDAWQKGSK